jgi:hypothetical protein
VDTEYADRTHKWENWAAVLIILRRTRSGQDYGRMGFELGSEVGRQANVGENEDMPIGVEVAEGWNLN